MFLYFLTETESVILVSRVFVRLLQRKDGSKSYADIDHGQQPTGASGERKYLEYYLWDSTHTMPISTIPIDWSTLTLTLRREGKRGIRAPTHSQISFYIIYIFTSISNVNHRSTHTSIHLTNETKTCCPVCNRHSSFQHSTALCLAQAGFDLVIQRSFSSYLHQSTWDFPLSSSLSSSC